MNKRYVMIFLCIAMISLLFSSCKINNKVLLDKEKSCFSSYEVKNDKVYFKYYITLKNTFDSEKTVRLFAKLPKDVSGGLLKNELIKALNEEGQDIEYTIPSNTKLSFDVVFVGDYAGTYVKEDKLLGDIYIDVVK